MVLRAARNLDGSGLGLYAGASLPRHADFPNVLAKIAAFCDVHA
jgi:hypothetical protein